MQAVGMARSDKVSALCGSGVSEDIPEPVSFWWVLWLILYENEPTAKQSCFTAKAFCSTWVSEATVQFPKLCNTTKMEN